MKDVESRAADVKQQDETSDAFESLAPMVDNDA